MRLEVKDQNERIDKRIFELSEPMIVMVDRIPNRPIGRTTNQPTKPDIHSHGTLKISPQHHQHLRSSSSS